MKKILFAAVLALAAVCTVSCKSEQIDLAGEWTVISVDGQAVNVEEMPTIAFNTEDNTYHARPGINLLNGSYTLKDNVLTLGNGAMTRMAGPENLMLLEDSIVAILGTPFTLKLENEVLSLCGADGKVALELKK